MPRASFKSESTWAAAAEACMTVSGMSLGSANGPATKIPSREDSAGRNRGVWQKLNGVQHDAESFGQRFYFFGWLHAHRQDDQVVFLGKLSVVLAEILDNQVPRARDFLDLRHARTDIAHAELLRPAVILLEALAEGAQVHEEDVALQTFAEMLFGDDGFFSGVHAADGGAVVAVELPRTDALQEGDPLRLLLVEGPAARGRSRVRRRRESARTPEP